MPRRQRLRTEKRLTELEDLFEVLVPWVPPDFKLDAALIPELLGILETAVGWQRLLVLVPLLGEADSPEELPA